MQVPANGPWPFAKQSPEVLHLRVPCAHLHVDQLNNRTILRFFSVSKYFGVFFAGLINSDLADPVGSEAEKRLGKDYAAKVEYVCFLST